MGREPRAQAAAVGLPWARSQSPGRWGTRCGPVFGQGCGSAPSTGRSQRSGGSLPLCLIHPRGPSETPHWSASLSLETGSLRLGLPAGLVGGSLHL